MTINQEALEAVSEAMRHKDAVSVSLPGTDWLVVRKSHYELLSVAQALTDQAADAEARAEAAEAENEKLREALEKIAGPDQRIPDNREWILSAQEFARAALTQTGERE